MANKTLDQIERSQSYHKLVSKRRKVIWPLSFLMILVYFSFIASIAFAPDLLSRPLFNSPVTWGLIAALCVILISFVITGIYVYIANKTLEPLAEFVEKEGRDPL